MASPRRPADRPALPPSGDRWPLPTITVPADRLLFRLTGTRFPDPAYFGRRKVYRFDAPDQSYGVCYLGNTLACCFLEVFPPFPADRGGRRFVALSQLRAYYAAQIALLRPLRLAHLAGDSLTTLGIDLRVTCGDDYDLAGAWSAAIHAHAERVDGILYPSRHHEGHYSVAFFERAHAAVRFTRWGDLGDDATPDLWIELNAVLARFQVSLLTDA
jgi:hypothetical protein